MMIERLIRDVAQLGEHLVCNQEVAGSIRVVSISTEPLREEPCESAYTERRAPWICQESGVSARPVARSSSRWNRGIGLRTKEYSPRPQVSSRTRDSILAGAAQTSVPQHGPAMAVNAA